MSNKSDPQSSTISERGLPSGWNIVNLDQVCHIERGITFPASAKKNESFETSIVCLRTANVQEQVDWDDLIFIPDNYVKKEQKLLRQNDILISMANSRELVGKVSFVDQVRTKSTFGAFIAAIRAKDAVTSKYLFYHLRSAATKEEMRRNSSQTVNIANLSLSRLYPTPINVAPKKEQERIVAEIEKQFTRLDAAVANLKRVQANLDRYKNSVLKAACEGRLVPQDPDDEPAEVLLERILAERRRKWEEQEWAKLVDRAQKKAAQAKRKKSGRPDRISDLEPEEWQALTEEEYGNYIPKNEKWKEKYKEPERVDAAGLPELPARWVWATPDQLSYRIVDCLHSTPKFEERGYLCVDTNCIKPGRIVVEKARFVDEETFHERNRRMVPHAGDVLFSREGALLGIAANVPENIEFCLGQRMMIFRLAEGINAKYLESVLNSFTFKTQYKKKITGTASPHLNIRDIRQFGIPLPPSIQQIRIADEVEAHLSIVSEIEKDILMNIDRSFRLQQAILYEAFRGRLIPQDPNDEPASALLARLGEEGRRGYRRVKKPNEPNEVHQPKLL